MSESSPHPQPRCFCKDETSYNIQVPRTACSKTRSLEISLLTAHVCIAGAWPRKCFQKKDGMSKQQEGSLLLEGLSDLEPCEICRSSCDTSPPPPPLTATAGCCKASANICPCEPLHCVFELLIYVGCLPRERNVFGHFFVVVKITS